MTSLRKILSITWQKHIPGHRILTRVSLLSIYKPSWCSHSFIGPVMLSAWDVTALRKKLPDGEQSLGKRSKGGQKKVKSFSIAPNCLEYLAHDRDKWREVVKHSAKVWWNQKKNLNCAGNSQKVLPHHPRPPQFRVLFRAHIDLISHLCTLRCLPQS